MAGPGDGILSITLFPFLRHKAFNVCLGDR